MSPSEGGAVRHHNDIVETSGHGQSDADDCGRTNRARFTCQTVQCSRSRNRDRLGEVEIVADCGAALSCDQSDDDICSVLDSYRNC